ncbi:MAG: AraC family transcriptional activator of pobA [Ascidiaceihabitans sp.]|jgi:AraC family transcriptional activator of pobA
MFGHIDIISLSALIGTQPWRLSLAHESQQDLLIWITRGQGRLLLNGTRRGVGVHNAIYIPAGQVFALDMGRQGLGHVAICPVGNDLRLPDQPRQLRVRDGEAIGEMSGLLEAAGREVSRGRVLAQDALDAHMGLISVWLRRQIALPENLPVKQNAAARLSARFCENLIQPDLQGLSMADHAAQLNVTPTHLTRVCKAATGRTAADIMTERQLHSAQTALIDTDVPLQEIARHLRFGSPAYFTRFIQHHTTKTPSALRKSQGKT